MSENQDIKLLEKTDDLLWVVENEKFVYDSGNWFCIAESCEGCEYKEVCQYEEDELEISLIKATRRNVGAGFKEDIGDEPSSEKIDINKLEKYQNKHLKWIDNEKGYLPISNKRIYKKIINIKETNYKKNEIPFVLYSEDDEAYYCVRQVCSNCKYLDKCKVELQEKDFQMLVVSNDIRSQEPRGFTILSKEPNWVSVFVNDNLRQEKGLLDFIDFIFREELRVDVKSDQAYFTYLDNRFFFDRTLLYKLNYNCLKYQETEKVEYKREIEKLIKHFKEDYNNFKENELGKTVKIANIKNLKI